MRTLTLSGSVLAPQSPLPPGSKPSKPFNSFPQCPNSCSKKHNSKLSCGNHRSVLSRRSRCSSANTYEEWVQHFLQANPVNLNGIDFRSFGCKHCKATADSLKNLDDHDALYKSSEKDNSENENDFATNIQKSEKSVDGLMKFALLLGLFMIQGSEQAIAGSDFAGGLQSTSFLGDLGDISTSFASAFLLIFFSELGDKTFFIAALLAARNSAAAVFTGTFGALAGMTIVSVGLGRTFHYVDELLPFRFGETDLPIDDIAAVFLLVYFGASTLLDVTSSDGLKTEDEKKELAVSEISGNGAGILAAANTVISTFLLVFVAEWGDKSFFSTIALAAASSPLGVIGGALAGHGIATLLAVLGGSLLGTFLSEKVIAYIGGVLFLVFAVVTLLGIIT